jgi:hypothetical protein
MTSRFYFSYNIKQLYIIDNNWQYLTIKFNEKHGHIQLYILEQGNTIRELKIRINIKQFSSE